MEEPKNLKIQIIFFVGTLLVCFVLFFWLVNSIYSEALKEDPCRVCLNRYPYYWTCSIYIENKTLGLFDRYSNIVDPCGTCLYYNNNFSDCTKEPIYNYVGIRIKYNISLE